MMGFGYRFYELVAIAYRFNRGFQFDTIPMRFFVAAIVNGLQSDAWLRSAEASSKLGGIKHSMQFLLLQFIFPFGCNYGGNPVADKIGQCACLGQDMKRSIPSISASPATGMVGMAERVAASVIKPLPVTPARLLRSVEARLVWSVPAS